jgi:hypothetical protein
MSERHDRVVHLLRDQGPPAPPSLRARIEAQQRSARPAATSSIGGRIALAGATAVAVLAVMFVVPALFENETIGAQDVHALGAQGSTSGPPAPVRGETQLLSETVEGVPFPNWTREFGWREVGYRDDTLAGRETETVFYHHEGHTIAYTIVSGQPLETPDDGVSRQVNGMNVTALSDDHGHDIVVFERGGRTCVLSGHVEHRSTLLELATWKGDGNV